MEEAAALDCSVEEICFYADISKQTYYNWMKEDPGFLDRLNELRQKPFLIARQTIITSLTDPNQAFRYMERKKPGEFGLKTKVEHSGSISTEKTETDDIHEAASKEYEEKVNAGIREKHLTAAEAERVTTTDCGVEDPNIICRSPFCISCRGKARPPSPEPEAPEPKNTVETPKENPQS
jgi:hypothetical protein